MKEKIQDLAVEDFIQLLKNLQTQYLEPQIKTIMKGELAELHSKIMLGFPKDENGDPDILGHRNYHEALIEQSKARTEYWQKLTFELSKWGLLGLLAWMVHEMWSAFLRGPKPGG
jgi:hypothetical protein